MSPRTTSDQALRQRPKIRPPRVRPRPNVPRRSRRSRCLCATSTGAASGRALRCSSARQRLAAPLLAQRAAGPQTEIEVVEDLRRVLVGHLAHCIACFADDYSHPPRFGPPFRARGRPDLEPALARLDRAGGPGARDRERRPDAPGPPRAARAGGRRFCAGSAAPSWLFPATTTSRTRSRRASPTPWRSSSASGRRPSPSRRRTATSVGLNSVRPWRHQSGGVARRQLERARERLRERPAGALRVVVLHHQLIGAPWRTRKRPVARRNHVLADAGRRRRRADPRRPHPPGTVRERHEFEVIDRRRPRRRRLDRARASAGRGRSGAARRVAASSIARTSGR